METGLQNTNIIQWSADNFLSAVFVVQNAFKVPQWYSVQEGDAIPYVRDFNAWTKNFSNSYSYSSLHFRFLSQILTAHIL